MYLESVFNSSNQEIQFPVLFDYHYECECVVWYVHKTEDKLQELVHSLYLELWGLNLGGQRNVLRTKCKGIVLWRKITLQNGNA